MRGGIRAALMSGAIVALAAPAAPQVHYEAQPRPIVTANSEEWYRLGEPITFEGHFYYAAGPQVYFHPNTMVRTGSYRGVPLYADTTIEPYSRVFVPLSGGLMQPYERRRDGELAGSTGSQAPSFPVAIASEATGTSSVPQAPAPPVLGPAPVDPDVDRRSGTEVSEVHSPPAPSAPEPGIAATSGALPPRRPLVQTGAKPRGLNEVFVNYEGYRWRSAGAAVELTAEAFETVGEYRGYPVYAERGAGKRLRRIYLPSRPGLIAPYERAGKPVTY